MNPLLQKSTAETAKPLRSKEVFVLLNNLIYGRGKKRLGWQWAKQIDPETEMYLDSLDFTQDGFKLVTTTDHQFTRGRAKIGEFNGWNLSRDVEQEQALQKLWTEGQSIWRFPIDKTATSGPHSNASTQINLPTDAAAKMREASMRIPDDDLGEDGREDEPHVTLKYGVKDDIDLVCRAVANQKPFNVTLGKTHVFEAGIISEGQAPVVVEAHAPELEALHNLLDKAVGTRKDDFPEYRPHVTLAYVKPEVASKYEGLNWVEGVSFPANAITLSGKGNVRIPVPFGQPKTAASDSDWEAIRADFMSGIVYHGTTEGIANIIQAEGFRGLEFDEIVSEVLGKHGKTLAELPIKDQEAIHRLGDSYKHEYRLVSTSPAGETATRWAGKGDQVAAQIEAYSTGRYSTRDVKHSLIEGAPAVVVARIKNFPSSEHYERAKKIIDGWQSFIGEENAGGKPWTQKDAAEDVWSLYVNFLCKPEDLEVLGVLTGGEVEKLKQGPFLMTFAKSAAHGIPIERHSDLGREQGKFWAPRGSGYFDYGEKRTDAVLDPKAKIYRGTDSRALAEQAGYMDNPIPPAMQEKYGVKTFRGLEENYPEIGDLNDYFDTFQNAAEDHLKAKGYQGALWSEEDDLSPVQYQIWDSSTIKLASHKTPPMSDTQYEPSGEYGQGQETNAYADIPERVKGEEDLPSLEELSPALFKQAYGDQSANLPMRGQKGIGGQDFPVLEEEEVFPEKTAAGFGTGAGTQLTPDESEIVAELGDLGISGNSRALPELEKVPLFPEEETQEKTAKGKTEGGVYLLHFNLSPDEIVPASREDAYTKKFHARHYLGFAENPQARIEQHYKAQSGVKLIDAVHAKGITFTVARIWDNVDRNFERKLKNQGGLSRHCPICKKLGIDRDSLYRKQVPAMSEGVQTVEKEIQVAPVEAEHGPDFVEQEKIVPKTAYPRTKTAQEIDEAMSHVFYIEVPPDVRDSFWREPPEGKLEFWAFKGRPSVLLGETIYFTMNRTPVAEAIVYKLEAPGQSACGETGRYLDHWKIVWLPSAFKKYALSCK